MDDAQIIATEFERNLQIVSDPTFESADPETQAVILTAAASEGDVDLVDAREVNPSPGTPQYRMQQKLQSTGIPYKEISVYGSQIVVTAWSRDAAEKWADLLGKFARVKKVAESIDYNEENRGTVRRPTTHTVWRVWATVAETNPSSTAKYYKVWFSKGSDRTAQIVVDTDRYPKGKTSVESYSRLFPYSEANKMTHLHIGDSFSTWEEAFESERVRGSNPDSPGQRPHHFRVERRGDYYYVAQYYRDGDRERLPLGGMNTSFHYQSEAQEYAEKLNKANRYPNPSRPYPDSDSPRVALVYRNTESEAKSVKSKLHDAGFNQVWTEKIDGRWAVVVPAVDARDAGAYVGRKYNPESAAASLSESFHGRPAQHTDEYVDELHVHEFLTELGDLVELSVETESGYAATIRFPKSDRMKLASSENGRQLYIQGRCDLDLDAIHMGSSKWLADLMVIGRITSLVYLTAKEQDGGTPTDYIHKSGEALDASGTKHVQATDVFPILLYDRLNTEFQIAGGQQEVTESGIIR